MTLQITNYEFGKMTIDDKTYTKDLIIYEDTVIENWWRKEGHLLCYLDLRQALYTHSPNALVIGTGESGMMVVPEEVLEEIKKLKIILTFVEKTPDAIESYKRLRSIPTCHPMVAFHLTC